ncbi:hydrogenase [Thermococcus chitonophagus]|uniref:Hydrogenase n=1 Tax=Thermococcus chitonophagus TaxID=54262 RepID=A0A170SQH7_9EURY|nr:NADH-quinone oxidoreductase subunit C [Thermococcus chitonophagus]ASJ16941.1 hydrogenase [Thermococcus chitonophagus]CUX78424.1 Membrane bound hydrogenase, NiFe-hydrogenase MbhK [Thermococcus chitonophagus]
MSKEEEFVEIVKQKFPEANVEIKENKWGRRRVWISVPRESFRDFMKFLKEYDEDAHYSIAIEEDVGDAIDFSIHLLLKYEDTPAISLIVKTSVPKDDPVLPDISDIFPISLQFEREAMEMIGIDFENAPDKRRLFLPDDFPEGIYPLRLDDKGIPEEMVKNAGHPYLLRRGK